VPADTLWIAPYLPGQFRETITPAERLEIAGSAEGATYQVDVGSVHSISRWVYALVAPFPTIPDGVTSQELTDAWNGLGSGPLAGVPLVMEQAIQDVAKDLKLRVPLAVDTKIGTNWAEVH